MTDQDLNQDQPEPYQLTGDDLSELHGMAQQLQAAGDPRADRVWNFIDAHSGGNPDPAAKGSVYRSPLKVTSWLEDLESTLWGDAANNSSAPEGGGDDAEIAEQGNTAADKFGVAGPESDDSAEEDASGNSSSVPMPLHQSVGRRHSVASEHSSDLCNNHKRRASSLLKTSNNNQASNLSSKSKFNRSQPLR